MAEAYAVTGYVSDHVAQELLAKRITGSVDVSPERGSHDVIARLDTADIVEVRVGAAVHGETLVQLILHDRAQVETIMRAAPAMRGIERLYDPVLMRLIASATAKTIVV
jgi:hypothetical protein